MYLTLILKSLFSNLVLLQHPLSFCILHPKYPLSLYFVGVSLSGVGDEVEVECSFSTSYEPMALMGKESEE